MDPDLYELFEKHIDQNLLDKSKVIEKLIEEYMKKREIKKKIYNNPAERMKFVNDIILNLNVTINKNILKPIIMKLIQIILLNDDKYAYTIDPATKPIITGFVIISFNIYILNIYFYFSVNIAL